MSADINDMMVFLTVVESGSFTLAAERLDMPKANVSRKVSKLEKSLGLTLLERSTRSQHLTEAGKRYLVHCKHIRDEVDKASSCVSELLSEYRGVIKVGTSVTMGQYVLQPHLARFMRQYPDVQLQLSLQNLRVDLIEQGFDVLIRVGNLADSQLSARRLGSVSRYFFASPEYLASRKPIENTKALEGCDFLIMTSSYQSRLEVHKGCERSEINVSPRIQTDDFSVVKQSAVDGLGIALLPDYLCSKEVDEGKLIKVLPEWQIPSVDVYALFPRHRANVPKVRAFIDFAVEVCEQTLS